MRRLVVLAAVGLLAQLIDGSLGMAYGVTSTTLLLAAAVAPASASAAVHLAEIGTTLVSGASHWRFGNVDWKVVGRIALPGAVGAFAGATVLSALSTENAAPWMAGILLALGIYILVRFAGWSPPTPKPGTATPGYRMLAPLGLFAGFVDATGGGGWGPVATPTLLVSGRLEPRKVIGSVDTSEFVVAVAASLGFLIGLGGAGIPFDVVAALLIGGVIAAPIAAYLVRVIPARMLGAAVGTVIVLTNTRTVTKAFDVPGATRVGVYLVLGAACAVVLGIALRAVLRERNQQQRLDPALAEAGE